MSAPRALVGRLGVLLAAVLGVLVWTATPAQAHAYLDGSTPGDGTSTETVPGQLRLAFSEHVVAEATSVRVYDARGHVVPVSGLRLVTDHPGATEEPAEIVVDLPPLAQGAYRVSWNTLSSDDLHRTSGVLVFGVHAAVHSAGIQEARPEPVEVVAGWFVLGGLSLALGGPIAAWVFAGVAGADRARRRVLRAGALGATVASVAALALPAREALTSGPATLLAGTYALRWGVREVGLLLLVVVLVRSQGPDRTRWHRAAVLSASLVTATGAALLGHAAAEIGADPLRLPVTTLHLWAALSWTGAVAGLGLGLSASRSTPVGVLRPALRRFAWPAAVCVAVAVVTGLLLVGDVVVSVDAALSTTYGRTLLAKLGLVAVVATLGLVNHRRLRGPRDLDLPRRTLLAEAVVAAAVVAATSVLIAAQPATEPQLVDAGPPPSLGPSARQVADLQESVAMKPNRPGDSVLAVDVFDTRRPASGPVSDVSVRLGGTPAGSARPIGDGHWVLPVHGLEAGPVDVTVVVDRAGTQPVVATYAWVVGPSAPPPSTLVSRAPIGGWLRASSAALVLLLVPVAGVALARRRRAGVRVDTPPKVEHSAAGRR